MATAPATSVEFIGLVRKSGVVDDSKLTAWEQSNPNPPDNPQAVAKLLLQDGLLTKFQAKQLLGGRTKGFILGQYRLLDQIGEGGMGVVLLAEHLTLQRKVAVKVLPASKASDAESLERFYREARIVAALDHPNIVRAYDANKSGPNVHFLVMEYVEGLNLEQLVRKDGKLPFRDAVNYIAQAALGLQHGFERNMVHRDIKPANLLLDKNGVLKILDMGLARYFDDNTDGLTKNYADGAVVGTADYIAPEQALNSHDVDTRADIYSLGATFYMLLSGNPPFAQNNLTQKLLAHQIREPASLSNIRSDLPPGILQVIARMMAKKPEDRYQTPQQVHDALTPWLQGPTASGGSSTMRMHFTTPDLRPVIEEVLPEESDDEAPPPRRAKKPKSKMPLVLGGLAVLALLTIVAIVVTSDGKPPEAVLPQADGNLQKVVVSRPVERVLPKATNTIPVPNSVELAPKIVVSPTPPVGELRKLMTLEVPIERMAITADGRWALVTATDGRVQYWDLIQEKLVHTLNGHSSSVRGVNFHPTLPIAATAGAYGNLIVWNLATGEPTKIQWVANAKFWSVQFLPERPNHVIAGTDDGRLFVWNYLTGTIEKTIPAEAKLLMSWMAAVPGTSNTYVLQSGNVELRVFSSIELKVVRKVQLPAKGRTMSLSSDGKRLIVGCDDGYCVMYDALTGDPLRELLEEKTKAQYYSSARSPDGKYIVLGGTDKNIRVIDVVTGKQVALLEGHSAQVNGLGFRADGRLVSCSTDRTVRLWQMPK